MSLCMCNPCLGDENDEERNIPDLAYDTAIPVKDRKRTDLPYFIVFIVLILFVVVCVGFAGAQREIRSHIKDHDIKECGYIKDPMEGFKMRSVLDSYHGKYELYKSERDKLLQFRKQCYCLPRTNCSKICRDTDSRILFRCSTGIQNNKKDSLKPFLEMVLIDLTLCWKEITALLFLSICLSSLFLMFLRMFPTVVIWTVLTIVLIACIGGTIGSWIMYHMQTFAESEIQDLNEPLEESSEKIRWVYFGSFFTIALLFYITLLFNLGGKIKLIATFFEEGGKCIKDIPMMLLQPVLTYLISGISVCFLYFGLRCFEMSGKEDIDEEGNIYITTSIFVKIATMFLFFACLWLCQFSLACQNIVIAGAVSSWYFSRVKGKLFNPVWQSVCMLVKYHLGSAAFGSLLITIIKSIKMLFRFFEESYRKSAVARFLFYYLMRCLLACIESFLQIINKFAYVMMVLFGEPFCISAKKAFKCITADLSRVPVVVGAGTLILVVVELLISFTVTFVGLALFVKMEGIQNIGIPTTVVFIVSYLCSNCFFSVYEMTIDTLILCFCVDHQMNNDLERPYYMNNELMVFLKVGEEEEKLDEASPDENRNATSV